MPITILLADQHRLFREGVAVLLQREPDLSIVAEAGSAQEAATKAAQHRPDVVVLGLALRGDPVGSLTFQSLLAQCPESAVLVLAPFLEENSVLASVEAGARGYLVQDCAVEELVAAIREVHRGKPYFCASAQEVMMQRLTRREPEGGLLSPRETEVLRLTAGGWNTKEIAYRIGVSAKMIEVNRMNIRKKLGLHSIAHLTTYALNNGLIPPSASHPTLLQQEN